MAVFDVKQWLSSLKTKHNIPDEDIPADEIEKGFLRQDEFSRRGKKLDDEHSARMKAEDEYHQRLTVAEQKLILVQQLEAKYGPAEQWSEALAAKIGDAHPELREQSRGQGNSFTLDQVREIVSEAVDGVKKELGQNIGNVGRGAAIMIDFMAEAPIKWKETYKTPFPKKEFGEFFTKSGTNDPYIAFDLFERPYAEKKRDEDVKTQVEEAERKGYQSAMSKFGNVESAAPTAQSGMFFKGGIKQPEVDPATGKAKPEPDPETSYEERKARVGNAFTKAQDDYDRGKVSGAKTG